MYRLFHRIPNGLNPVADTFRKHVEDEGNKLVNETAEAIEAKKDKDKESGEGPACLPAWLVVCLHRCLTA
jgi:cullin 1